MRFKKKQKISLSLCTTYDFSEYDEIKIHSIEVQLNFQELFKSQFGTFLLVASCREQDVLELYITYTNLINSIIFQHFYIQGFCTFFYEQYLMK